MKKSWCDSWTCHHIGGSSRIALTNERSKHNKDDTDGSEAIHNNFSPRFGRQLLSPLSSTESFNGMYCSTRLFHPIFTPVVDRKIGIHILFTRCQVFKLKSIHLLKWILAWGTFGNNHSYQSFWVTLHKVCTPHTSLWNCTRWERLDVLLIVDSKLKVIS